MSWANRVERPPTTPKLRQVQVAADTLAAQAVKTPVIFHTVADCAVIATVFIPGTLTASHLYKALSSCNKEASPPRRAVGGNRSPPRRPGRRRHRGGR